MHPSLEPEQHPENTTNQIKNRCLQLNPDSSVNRLAGAVNQLRRLVGNHPAGTFQDLMPCQHAAGLPIRTASDLNHPTIQSGLVG